MEWGISYFGITYGGCIAVPIDPALKEKEITHILQFSESKAIFTEERLLGMVKELATKLNIKLIITLDNLGEKTMKEVIEEGKELLDEKGEKEVEVRGNHTASIIFTSGTTGIYKAIELTHYNFNGVWIGNFSF